MGENSARNPSACLRRHKSQRLHRIFTSTGLFVRQSQSLVTTWYLNCWDAVKAASIALPEICWGFFGHRLLHCPALDDRLKHHYATT
jgi:hypothetical protein